MAISIVENKNCIGCAACYSLCPSAAVTMKENEEGFLFPVIETDKCTECGLCVKICPALNPQYKNNKNPECYAAMASDEIRAESSSGGVFPVLAYHFLEHGGYVAGAVWETDGSVKHIVSDKRDDIENMRGSKYLQSVIGDCFKDIKTLLEENKKVLFTGTPCQVAGLYAFLRKDYENLYTVELICHGVPSPKVFKKYLAENLEKDEKFVKTDFRDKIYGWDSKLVISTQTSQRKITHFAADDSYMQSFLKNISLRESCGDCKFNRLPRQSDMTIGDFWLIRRYRKQMDDKKGTSVILVNNLKGSKLLKNIADNFKILKKVPLKYGIKGNPNIVQSSKMNIYRELFFKSIASQTLEKQMECYFNGKADFLLVNFWDSFNNYGALMTAYAMQQLIRSFGYTPLLLDTGERSVINNPSTILSRAFAPCFFALSPQMKYKNAMEFSKNLKGVIVGSDQVLRFKLIKSAERKYLLDFVAPGVRKIALSASFGVDKKGVIAEGIKCKNTFNAMKQSLKSFDYLSCREISGVEVYKDVFGLDSEMILDPVFLIDKVEYEPIVESCDVQNNDKIASYILDNNGEYQKLYDFLQSKYQTEIVNINVPEMKNAVGHWLNTIKNCKCLVTDSFHGVCFALIYNKPFVCIRNIRRGSARFDSLEQIFDIKNSFYNSVDEVLAADSNFELDYAKINQIMAAEKERCLKRVAEVLAGTYSNNPDKIAITSKKEKNRLYFKYFFNVQKYKLKKHILKKQRYVDKEKIYKHKCDWGL